ncbi:MAG TPA: hypothetical protein VFG77_00555 [Nitrososphaeraceae archaeon]|jgi:hypothetical protein|nr:hypothetical protein [Nitrososphaeraceae archaeon]
MNTKYLAVVAALAVMLVAATAFATTDSALATKYKSTSQAVAQTNDCGNGELPLNVWCQNTASQIQGEDNEAALSSSQGARADECPTCPA